MIDVDSPWVRGSGPLSVRLGRELDEVPVERVQDELTRQGVRWA